MFFKRFVHNLAALVILLSLVNPTSAGWNSARAAGHHPEIALTLDVDTAVDSNDPAQQACLPEAAGDCSLRGALTRANAFHDGEAQINLSSGLFTLALAGEDDLNQSGDLDLTGRVTLLGAGQEATVISANQIDRVLDILSGGQVTLRDLTVRDGQAGPGEAGGGLRNRGVLTLERVTVSANAAGSAAASAAALAGGPGGGIFNKGRLSLLDSLVTANRAGDGGDLPLLIDYDSRPAGAGGSGGGIYNRGNLTINHSQVTGNTAGAGGDGPECSGSCVYPTGNVYAGGAGGDGGGIYNLGAFTGAGLVVADNQPGRGGNGGSDVIWSSPGGDGGRGAGIFNADWMQVSASYIEQNTGSAGGDSGYGMYSYVEAGPGYPGGGGGLFNTGQATFADVTISANRLLGGRVGDFYRFAAGGGAYNAPGARLDLVDCRLDGNFASGLGGGLANDGGAGLTGGAVSQNNARDLGGGVFNNGTLEVSQALINLNLSGPGYPGFQKVYKYYNAAPTDGLTPSGGGVFNAGDARLTAVQVLDNQAGDGGQGGNSGDYQAGADGAPGGAGGGIANSGVLEINDSLLQGNRAGRGGERGYSYLGHGDGENGPGGAGGGIMNWGKLTGAFVDLRENQTGEGFSATEPGGSGGGLMNWGELHWRDGRVTGNATPTGGNGGGLCLDTGNLSSELLQLYNTEIVSNTAGADGGGLFLSGSNYYFWNLIIAKNQVGPGRFGSGVFLADYSVFLDQATIAANTGGDGSGVHIASGTLGLAMSIVAGQQVGLYVAEAATAKLARILWGAQSWANGADWAGPGELVPGTDDLTADPGFLVPELGDFHLAAGSPAIDAAGAGRAADLDNQPRPFPAEGANDLGADEYWPLTPLGSVTISGPTTVTAGQPVTYSATISPPDATPSISYFWLPAPHLGQWAAEAEFVFPTEGTYKLQVEAINAGSRVTGELAVVILPDIREFYLPLVMNR